MAHTLTVLTLQLAQAIGLYALAAGILLVTRPQRLAAILDNLESSPALAFTIGLLAWAIGVGILVPHHLTHDWLALLVTATGLVSFVEGLVMIAAPEPYLAFVRRASCFARLWGIVSIVLGLILFLAGFTGRADALS